MEGSDTNRLEREGQEVKRSAQLLKERRDAK